MTEIETIHRHLVGTAADKYPSLHRLLVQQGPMFIPRRLAESLFVFLARTLINQRLSAQVANTIWQRLVKLAQAKQKPTREIFAAEYEDAIRKAGVSSGKTKALLAMRDMFADQQLGEEGLLRQADYQAVSELVTGLWGFGQWSADMTAIFYLGMPDIWPSKDGALARGLHSIFNGTPPLPLPSIAADFAPYRSYLALHIWRFLDQSKAKAS